MLLGDYDAGAVSRRTLEGRTARTVSRLQDTLRVFWSGPRYSHCCFTAHRDLDAGIAQQITAAFLALRHADRLGKEVLDAEGCQAFVPGITTGWEALESALREPSADLGGHDVLSGSNISGGSASGWDGEAYRQAEHRH